MGHRLSLCQRRGIPQNPLNLKGLQQNDPFKRLKIPTQNMQIQTSKVKLFKWEISIIPFPFK